LTARLREAGFGAARDVTELEAEARSLDTAAQRLAAEAGQRAAQAANLATLHNDLETLGRQITDAETRIAELAQRHTAELDKAAAAAGRAAAHRDTLRAQLGDQPDLDTALASAHAAAEALTAAADAADATARATQADKDAQAAAVRAAAEAGFTSTEAAAQAQRDAAWRTATDRAVREHDAAVASVASQLASADLDVKLDPPADVTSAAEAATTAAEAHDAAIAEYGRAEGIAEQLATLVPRLTARLDALRPLAERAAQTRRLADLAAGQGANTLRMTLSSFVLAARLEEVAAAASERLLRMTAGRYSLAHTDSRRGGGRSGLGLFA